MFPLCFVVSYLDQAMHQDELRRLLFSRGDDIPHSISLEANNKSGNFPALRWYTAVNI